MDINRNKAKNFIYDIDAIIVQRELPRPDGGGGDVSIDQVFGNKYAAICIFYIDNYMDNDNIPKRIINKELYEFIQCLIKLAEYIKKRDDEGKKTKIIFNQIFFPSSPNWDFSNNLIKNFVEKNNFCNTKIYCICYSEPYLD